MELTRHHSLRHHRPPPPSPPCRRFSVCFGRRSVSAGGRGADESLVESQFRDAASFMRPAACPSLEKMMLDPDDRHASSSFLSRGSDTSSAYSGSDGAVDLSGLHESLVDSDDDDPDSIEVSSRDTVRECLEKAPAARTEEDVARILDYMQHLPAFANLTLSVRRALCGALELAECGGAAWWCVLLNGDLPPDAGNPAPALGHSFFSTCAEWCGGAEVARVTSSEYARILHAGEESMRAHTDPETGALTHVTEADVIIRGTPARLLRQLVEDNSGGDATYVEDFLLTSRTFFGDAAQVAHTLLLWFDDPRLRDRVTRVVLLWVHNHFADFEADVRLMHFLDHFEIKLQREGMSGQQRLLNMACAAKAKIRLVTVARSTRDEPLPFTLIGGYEAGGGTFIDRAEPKAEEAGLRRGDQVLEVNGHSFSVMSHARALELLRGTTHLCVTVQSNLLGFREMSCAGAGRRCRKASEVSLGAKGGGGGAGHRARLRRVLAKMNILPARMHAAGDLGGSDDSLHSSLSRSDPDLSSCAPPPPPPPEHVLRVFRPPDHASKYLLVHKETTAREVVMLALREFGITESSSHFCLCEVSAGEGGVLKQRRLPDPQQGLADRIALCARYYVRRVAEPIVTEELAADLLRDGHVHLLHLKSGEVAAQLTLEDFAAFRRVEPTDHVDDLFAHSTPDALAHFAQLVNHEMFWVVTEVCSEPNLLRRMRILKQFIKVARHCRECRNFNSMFAVLSGLGHGAVSRLRLTWDRLPAKYAKLFEDLQEFMDPSRNMYNYRNLLNSEHIRPPMIPFYPVFKKDLTFIHLGNDSLIDGLVNFEKLRMIAKEIRTVMSMCSAPYDLFGLLEHPACPHPSAATLRRPRKKSIVQPNPRRMFEEAQMVRRVQAYLRRLRVVEDEEQLHALSADCEPHGRRRPPSPQQQDCSRRSGAKCGGDSPPVRTLGGRRENDAPIKKSRTSGSVTSSESLQLDSGHGSACGSPHLKRHASSSGPCGGRKIPD